MEQNVEKALEMLRELSVRLGTTVEALWPAVVYRVVVEAAVWVAVWGLLAVAAGIWLKIAMRTPFWSARYANGELTDVAANLRVFSIVGFIASLVAFGLAVAVNVPALIVPEADALKFIRSFIR